VTTSQRPPARRRNAAESRQALLMAAKDLFDERGFQRTTTRDIGERAGLDPTLIARYFGSKAALYLATMRSEFAAGSSPGDLLTAGRMTELLDRVADRGAGPIFDTALRRHPDAAVDAEAKALLGQRVIRPLAATLTERKIGDAELLAEMVSAAFIGIAVGRHTGAFPSLSTASSEQVAELLRLAFGGLLDSSAGPVLS
jgi:AcrR family transcriptional regulator